MQGMMSSWLWSSGDHTQTQTIDIQGIYGAPQFVLALITLDQVSDNARAGIIGFVDGNGNPTVFDLSGGLTTTSFSSANVRDVTYEIFTVDGFGHATSIVTLW